MRYMIGFNDEHDTLDSYLGFGSRVVGAAYPCPKSGEQIRIVATPDEHASWQSMRLGSGLRGGLRIFRTMDEACVEAAAIAQYL